jgi:hypothetical protein
VGVWGGIWAKPMESSKGFAVCAPYLIGMLSIAPSKLILLILPLASTLHSCYVSIPLLYIFIVNTPNITNAGPHKSRSPVRHVLLPRIHPRKTEQTARRRARQKDANARHLHPSRAVLHRQKAVL